MPKFFFDEKIFDGKFIKMQGETAHHIINVLRHRVGDDIVLCDGRNTDYASALIETDRKLITAKFEVQEVKQCLTEPSVFVRLFQSVIKWENFDFAIQKSVEVGVSEIVPIMTDRCIYKIADVYKKTERFNRIAKSAAEQSYRGILPTVTTPKSLTDSLEGKEAASFFACFEEKGDLFDKVGNMQLSKADLWIGPEGGFTSQEKKSLLASGVIPFSLGPRVLRSETASIVSVFSILQRSW